jgi:hypothetical protein
MHYALNHLLWCPCPGVQVVGTAECGAYVLRGGNYTDPNILVPVDANGNLVQNRAPLPTDRLAPVAVSARGEFFYVGPGFRLFLCEKLDVGVGSYFAVTTDSFAQQQLRAEFRWRF